LQTKWTDPQKREEAFKNVGANFGTLLLFIWFIGIFIKEIGDQYGSIISADEMIYCYTFEGKVMLLEALNNKVDVVSSFKLPKKENEHCSYMVINNGRLYIRYHDILYVYNISSI